VVRQLTVRMRNLAFFSFSRLLKNSLWHVILSADFIGLWPTTAHENERPQPKTPADSKGLALHFHGTEGSKFFIPGKGRDAWV